MINGDYVPSSKSSGYCTIRPRKYAIPANLRIADLVAKAAHVTLKDTIRVMKAVDIISWYLAIPVADLVVADLDSSKPSPINVDVCNTEYDDLSALLKKESDDVLDQIRSID